MFENLGTNLFEFLVSVYRLAVWLTILVAIFVPLERLCAVQPRKIFRKDFAADLGYYFLNGLLPAMLLSVPVSLLTWVAHSLVPTEILTTAAALPLWGRVVVGLVVSEIGFYWGHRWSHEIPFLWGFHSIHHDAEHLDFLVNTRAHPVDIVFGRFCGFVPIYALGLANAADPSGSQVPVLVTIVTTLWGFFIHSNVRWRFGPLEWLIATPGFHHWHHTRTGPINRNYAATLPWLDWLFGTLHLPRGQWPAEYGIKGGTSQPPEALAASLPQTAEAEPISADTPS